jgi:hypothetical protein
MLQIRDEFVLALAQPSVLVLAGLQIAGEPIDRVGKGVVLDDGAVYFLD